MESNADQSTTCFQNLPIPPCALPEQNFPRPLRALAENLTGTILRAQFLQIEKICTLPITKNEKSKDYCKADQNNMYCFFITIFRLAIPAFFRFTDVTELMQESQYYIDGECRNRNCLKGRGGNDVQNKNWKRKNDKDMDYNNSSRRFRPLGSRVMALSIKCYSLALRTESREE